jgi:excisionase family DNA binding protein
VSPINLLERQSRNGALTQLPEPATTDPAASLPVAPRYFDYRQAAEYCHVDQRTIYAWTRQRGLRFAKVGKRVLIDRFDLEAFLECHKTSAPLVKEDNDGNLYP